MDPKAGTTGTPNQPFRAATLGIFEGATEGGGQRPTKKSKSVLTKKEGPGLGSENEPARMTSSERAYGGT